MNRVSRDGVAECRSTWLNCYCPAVTVANNWSSANYPPWYTEYTHWPTGARQPSVFPYTHHPRQHQELTSAARVLGQPAVCIQCQLLRVEASKDFPPIDSSWPWDIKPLCKLQQRRIVTSEQALELTVYGGDIGSCAVWRIYLQKPLTESVDTEILLRLGHVHLKGNVFKTTANLAANRLKLSSTEISGKLLRRQCRPWPDLQ